MVTDLIRVSSFFRFFFGRKANLKLRVGFSFVLGGMCLYFFRKALILEGRFPFSRMEKMAKMVGSFNGSD